MHKSIESSKRLKQIKAIKSILCIHKSLQVALSDLSTDDIDNMIKWLTDEIALMESKKLKIVKIEKL